MYHTHIYFCAFFIFCQVTILILGVIYVSPLAPIVYERITRDWLIRFLPEECIYSSSTR